MVPAQNTLEIMKGMGDAAPWKRRFVCFTFAAAAALSIGAIGLCAQEDPPSRVARLNYVSGQVSMQVAGADDWVVAEVNRPFTVGDFLYAGDNSTAELHLDIAVIRAGAQASFGFLNLDDRTVQLKLTGGDLSIRVHDFAPDQVFEVDTPNAAVNLLRDGVYRFRVDPNGTMSFLVVREGQAEITGGGQAFTLNRGNSASLTGVEQLAYDIELAPQADEFDQWCQRRDAHEARLASARYLPPAVIGYEDLDDYGNWQNTGDEGPVWYPRQVDAGWAPYHDGHWSWIEPWGWTWIDSMPWGFAPFHYGRWAYIGNRWGWCPGPVGGWRGGGPVIRPYYAPAMVAWFGGAHWGAGISTGGGPSLGWVPLGRGEIYTPAYRCSPRYFNNVNVNNTRIVKTVNITNVYNNVYINKQVYNQQFINSKAPNAVMAMPQSAFAGGRPVRQAATPVRSADLVRLQTVSVVRPPVAPTPHALLATTGGRTTIRPAPQVMSRQVIARSVPPPAPASTFAARQPSLQQRQPGQPGNMQAAPQNTSSARPAQANVRQVPAVRPVAVQPGQKFGEAAINRPAPNRPAAPASQQQPRPFNEGADHAVSAASRGATNPPVRSTPSVATTPNRPTAPEARPASPARPTTEARPANPVRPITPEQRPVNPPRPVAPTPRPEPDRPSPVERPASPERERTSSTPRTEPRAAPQRTEPSPPPSKDEHRPQPPSPPQHEDHSKKDTKDH